MSKETLLGDQLISRSKHVPAETFSHDRVRMLRNWVKYLELFDLLPQLAKQAGKNMPQGKGSLPRIHL
ncbi:MAG TPA: hypothetical protein VFG52_06410 [Xanthomonadales bacterium]|nr:hypothetical protein [Xanthomonadales bacterium]